MAALRNKVMVLNAGSSSLKFKLYQKEAGDVLKAVATGYAERIGDPTSSTIKVRARPAKCAAELAAGARVRWAPPASRRQRAHGTRREGRWHRKAGRSATPGTCSSPQHPWRRPSGQAVRSACGGSRPRLGLASAGGGECEACGAGVVLCGCSRGDLSLLTAAGSGLWVLTASRAWSVGAAGQDRQPRVADRAADEGPHQCPGPGVQVPVGDVCRV